MYRGMLGLGVEMQRDNTTIDLFLVIRHHTGRRLQNG